MQASVVPCDSDIIIVIVLLLFNSVSTCLISIHFIFNICVFEVEFYCNSATNAQILISCPRVWHCLLTKICPLVLGIKKTGCFFFFFYFRSGASCVYLIINACGLHFNSFKLIISESWIKDKGVKMFLYGLVYLFYMSSAQMNYVHAVVKHAWKRGLNFIPLTHFRML